MFKNLDESKKVWKAFGEAFSLRKELSLYMGVHYYRWWLWFMLRNREPWLSIKAVKKISYLSGSYQYHRLYLYHKQKSLWGYWIMKSSEDVCLKIPDNWVIPVLIEMYIEFKDSIEVRFDEYVVKLRNRGELFVENVRRRANFDDLVRKLCQYRSFPAKN